MTDVRSETPTDYAATTTPERTADDAVIAQALDILTGRLAKPGAAMKSPAATSAYLALTLGTQEREVFACIFLDSRNRVLSYEELFFGTIDGASVHPREVVKRALKTNAAAVIFAHNHPSGEATPSAADRTITKKLSEILAVIDVRALDHVIVGGDKTYSFAEHGLM